MGIVTAYGQGSLPFELASLANSAAPWSFVAFLLALVLAGGRPRVGALVGCVALASMLAGYMAANQVRGYESGLVLLVFWGAAAVAVGPVLGVAASWVRGPSSIRVAAGIAPIAGILIGEGAYGLTVVAATTSAAYWVVQIGLGASLVALVAVRLRNAPRVVVNMAACAGLTVLVASAFYVGYSGDLLGRLSL